MFLKVFSRFRNWSAVLGFFHVFQRFSVIFEIGQLFSADFRRFPCYPVVLEIGQLFLGLLRSLKVDFHVSQRFGLPFKSGCFGTGDRLSFAQPVLSAFATGFK